MENVKRNNLSRVNKARASIIAFLTGSANHFKIIETK
jgi:hypothetical protein